MTDRAESVGSGKADTRPEELHRQMEQLRQELEAARVEIECLQQDTHRWWSVADKYRRELLSVHASRSWRLTWPLRQANLTVRQLATAAWHAIRQILRLPRRNAKTLLLWSIRRVLARPRLRAGAERLLAHHPGLRQRLRSLAMAPASQAIEPQIPKRGETTQCLSELSATVYVELLQALEERKC